MIVEVLTDNSSYFQPSVLLVFCPKLSMSTFFVVQIFSIVVISNVFKYVRDLCLFMYLSCKGFSKGIFCHIWQLRRSVLESEWFLAVYQ